MEIDQLLNSTGPPISVVLPNSYVVVPSIFFWILTPVIIHDIKTSRLSPLPWSTLMSLKWFVASLLIIDRLFVFLLAVWESLFEHKNVTADLFIFPFFHSFTLLALLIATNETRRAGIHSSGCLFCVWMLFAVFAAPEFYQWMNKGSQPEVNSTNELFRYPISNKLSFQLVARIDFFRYVAYLTYFPLVVAEFVLHFVSDPFPMPKTYQQMRFFVQNSKCPEENANFISRQLLMWFSQIISLGSKKTLETEDVFELDSQMDQEYLKARWKTEWLKQSEKAHEQQVKLDEKRQRSGTGNEKAPLLGTFNNYGAVNQNDADRVIVQPSVIFTLWNIMKWELVGGSFIKFLSDLLQFANPTFLNFLITFIETPDAPLYYGVALAIGMFLAGQAKSLFMNTYFIVMTRIGAKIQTMLSCAVYEKSLLLSNSARRERTVGEMVNILSIDVDRFRMITPQLQQYWSSPFQIIVCMVLLWQTIGVAVWAGIVVMISIVPINICVSVITKKWQIRLMKYKDERIRLINEVLNGIKVVKLSAWETAMEETIEKIRDKELKMIKQSSLLKTFADCLNVGAPVFVALATFTVFVFIDEKNVLTPNIAFVSLSLFNLLRGPLMMAADLVAQTVQLVVSNKRIRTFLCEREVDVNAIDKEIRGELYQNTVEVHSGSFSWDLAEARILSDIEFLVGSKELVTVVGSVGSGKSSLLLAALGEMEKICGYVGVRGSVAYLSQQPWILNQSLKKNILMQADLNDVLYKKVVEACALKDDLKQLPDGDETEIGEKGINLSGGQKARIALARAVYQSKDVYFLDDPLSAVDAHVGKHIFDNIIGPNGMLSHTTRILVTNCTSFLQESGKIIVMKDGRIRHCGTYDELLADDEAREYLQEVDAEYEQAQESSEEESGDEADDVLPGAIGSSSRMSRLSKLSKVSRKKSRSSIVEKKKPDALITKEEAAVGRVKAGIYMLYFKSMGIVKYVLPYFVAVILNMAFAMARSLWLTAWSDANIDMTHPDTLSVGTRLGVYAAFGVTEGRFFFIQDQEIQKLFFLFFSLSLLLLGGVAASRNLHRPLLHNVLRNPLSYFDVTPIGRIINRLAKDMEVVDLRLSSSFRFLVISFMNMMQTVIIVTYTTPLFIVIIIPVYIIYYFVLKYSIKSTRQLQRIASLTRSPIFSNFSETLQGISTVRAFQWNDEFIRRNDMHLNTHVRCNYYSQMSNRWLAIRLELLGNIVIFGNFQALFSSYQFSFSCFHVSHLWERIRIDCWYARSISITFMLNMFVRTINDVETNVVSVERIDEYSKTKSEAEWRMEGYVLPQSWPIGGAVNIEDYSCRYRDELDLVLKQISLNILPGQKVGVCGRTGAGLFNIDPKSQFNDQQLWAALENSNLKAHVETLPQKLESPVAEGGENFSVGQRQLLCLTRALLRKSKVLVLDEATAGIDNRTDAMVQATIREKFADSTIITIAHRLHTIMDYDRIIVMEAGRIVEDGIPGELLKNKNSKFYGLAKSAKIVG
ncbi:Protein CBR-MRP-3 [Caenorhabditis briggsae]|uniref:Protein CBR-MRP-3 n=1 Tax=Caenorhabditis briggsae TaxID=6238 RepID=A8XNB9_CAEBR|nr:Protein CBR-MRP-3 [Caenorhabditis briggsae]CAP34350.2 Protein CBR-MRP-3 [Caenorhabditis briggsae]